MPIGHCLIDATNRYLEVNRAYCRIYGYTREELLGQPITLVVPQEEQAAVLQAVARFRDTGRDFPPIRRRRRKDGSPIWTEGQAALLAGEEGQPLVLLAVTDITGRRAAEEALAARTAQLEAVQAVGVEITRETDLLRLLELILERAVALSGGVSGSVRLWDEAAQLLVRRVAVGAAAQIPNRPLRLGEGVAGVVARTRRGVLLEAYPASPHALPHVAAQMGAVALLCEPLLYRDRLIGVLALYGRTGGRPFAPADQALLRLFADQAAIAIENARLLDAVRQELASRREAEETLRFHAAIATGMAEGIVLVRASDRLIVHTNPIFDRLFGYAAGELVGQPVRVLGAPGKQPPEAIAAEIVQQVESAGAWTGELQNIKKDGTLFWCRAAVSGFNHERHGRAYLGIYADVTERRRAELALRESEARFRRLAENAPDMIYRMALPEGRYEYVSPAATQLFGYSPEEFYRRPLLIGEIIHPAWRDYFEREWRRLLAGETPGSYEFQVIHASGEVRWVNQRNILVRDAAGRPVALEGIVTEVTARKQAEATLRASEQRLTLAIAGSGVGLWDWRVPTGEADFSERWAEIVGYTLAELAPCSIQTWTSLCHPDDLARSQAMLQRHFAGASPVYECEVRMRHKAGHWVWVLDRGTVTEWAPDGTPLRMTGIHLDLTARKQLEEARLVQSKLEATGVLAGGIAHDFNNLLTVILGNLEILEMADWRERGGSLDAIYTAISEAHALTRQFLTFAQGGARLSRNLALARVLEEEATAALRGSPIRYELAIAPDLLVVRGDPGQLGQAIRNLLLNAREAMPAGGGLALRAANLPGPSPLVQVTLADTGPGIPPEILPRIFDPYFSTKQRGEQRGMGLGLTVARSIVEKHGGTLTVASQPGEGTTVEITLPALSPEAPAPGPGGA